MDSFLIFLLIVGIVLIIGFTILTLNGDDGSAWSHNALSDEEHHWE